MDNVTDRSRRRDRGRARRRGGPDRRPGRRADPRRGARRAAGDDQLRDHLRDLGAGAARVRRRSAAVSARRRGCCAGARRRDGREALAEGDEAWIVGGAVRDALADRRGRRPRPRGRRRPGGGRAPDRRGRRRSGVRALGRVRDLARARPRPRLARRRQPRCAASRSRPTSPQRDFTVNAIAVPLADPAARADRPARRARRPRARLLRAVSERSFADDPLRILRAARLGAELGFELEPATVRAGARVGRRAPASPPASASSPSCGCWSPGRTRCAGWRCSTSSARTAGVLPELAALRGVEQNPNHHLDVHGHTLEVLAKLLEVERDLERYAGDARRRRPRRCSPSRSPTSSAAATRCASARSSTTSASRRPARSTSGGFVSFVGHDREGAELVRRRCARLKASRALARHLEALTLHHLHLGLHGPRAPALAPAPLRLPAADRAGRRRRHPAHGRRPARRPRQRPDRHRRR